MYQPSESHKPDNHEHTADAGDAFDRAVGTPPAPVTPDQVAEQMAQMMHDFSATSGDFSFEELHGFQQNLETLTRKIQAQKVPALLERMKARVAPLSDPEAPRFGMQYVAATDAVNCRIRLDYTAQNSANYVSYSYAKHNRGFVNEITLNPTRVNSEDRFISSKSHESFHSLQKHTSPALQRSPFNPETRAIIHPADWIMLEALCESDAYTKQAFMNSMLAKIDPQIRASTNSDVVSVDDFEKIRAASPSLEDAVVTCALQALTKPTKVFEPNGRTFVHHYQDVALNNYSAGMAMRKKEGEKDLVFLRIELDDMWQVGNYGVGPNSFGEHVKEPLIATRHKLSAGAQEKLDRICKEYSIPPLENCPTLREYEASLAFIQAQTMRAQSSARAYTP